MDATQANPSWQTDGKGLRGDQPERTFVIPNAEPTPMPLSGSDRQGQGSGGGLITVTVEDASGYAPGAGVASVPRVNVLTFDQDMFEIYDGGGGQCVVKLKVCDATCGAAPP